MKIIIIVAWGTHDIWMIKTGSVPVDKQLNSRPKYQVLFWDEFMSDWNWGESAGHSAEL